jgi:hypothetical protein
MNILKEFNDWLSEQKEESFSSQLLRVLRDERSNVDIRDVRELLHLGADPNYKMLVHTDEERMDKIMKIAQEEEWDRMPSMKMQVYKLASITYPILNTRPDVLKVMLEYGADPNLNISDVAISSGNPTPFVYAATQADQKGSKGLDVLKVLVDAGADVNATDSNGNNALHKVVKGQAFGMIQPLIDLGVDPFKKNNEGKMPYDLINTWSEYYVDGKITSGSEVAHKYRSILLPPEDASKTGGRRSFFTKKR